MRRSISTSVSLPFEMLERLEKLARRLRVQKSIIVRDALSRELERYDKAEATIILPEGSSAKEPVGSRP